MSVSDHDGEGGRGCAWCDGPLPDPAEAFAIVYGNDGAILLTCGLPCLAMLVATLAGRSAQARRDAGGVRN
jgi:hypothetical protein